MPSSALTPGNETKMKDISVLRVLSSNLVFQGTKILTVQVCDCSSVAEVKSGPPFLAFIDPQTCTLYKSLDAVKCWDRLIGK